MRCPFFANLTAVNCCNWNTGSVGFYFFFKSEMPVVVLALPTKMRMLLVDTVLSLHKLSTATLNPVKIEIKDYKSKVILYLYIHTLPWLT